MMPLKIIGKITNIESIAMGKSIRELKALKKKYGQGRWRKLKGIAKVQLVDGSIHRAEIHWYEAHGIGKRKIKIKHYLDAGI